MLTFMPDQHFTAVRPPADGRWLISSLHAHRVDGRGRPFRRLPAPFAAVSVTVGAPGAWQSPAGWTRHPRCALHGVFTQWSDAVYRVHETTSILMALIEPFAARLLFGDSSVNQVLDLERLRPDWTSALLDRLEDCTTTEAALAELGAALCALRPAIGAPANEVLAFLKLTRDSAGAIRVADATDILACPERQFRELFNEHVGVSPKQWCIVERFASNLRRLHPQPWENSASRVPDYFDQPHEIREFRRLAGITPGQYRQAKLAGDRRVYAVG